MLTVFRERPSIVLEAQKAKFKPNFLIQVLIFIGVYQVTQIAMTIPLIIINIPYMINTGLIHNKRSFS